MAKRVSMKGKYNPLASTTAAPAEQSAEQARKSRRGEDPVSARGIAVKASEWAAIDQLASEMGLNSHRVTVMLLRYGLEAYRTGKIKTKTKTITVKTFEE